jgi:hypothetical protein
MGTEQQDAQLQSEEMNLDSYMEEMFIQKYRDRGEL